MHIFTTKYSFTTNNVKQLIEAITNQQQLKREIQQLQIKQKLTKFT